MSYNQPIKNFTEIDNITFTMSILEEYAAKLNGCSPLAEKIKSAHSLLDKIRGGCPIVSRDTFSAIRERIYREVEREYLIADLESLLVPLEKSGGLQGMTAAQVLANEEILEQILQRFHKFGVGEDYWYNLQAAVEYVFEDIAETQNDIEKKYLSN